MTRRTIVALAGAATLLAVAAPTATADPAKGKVDRTADKIGYQVNVGDGWLGTIPTNLIGFTLNDGTNLSVYCVEIQTDIDAEHEMAERPWDAYPNPDSPFHKNRAKINWVLHHGYPAKALEALATALPTPPNDGLDELEAIAATQAAVWHYSDNVALNREDPLSGDGSDAEDAEDALALYDYLTGEKNTGLEEPTPTLELTPSEATGKAGEKIGPFKVTTTGTVEELIADLPEGTTLTDAEGNPATTATKELYVNVPADASEGSGTFEVKATGAINTGRLFVGTNYEEHPTQSLIVAKSDKTTLTAKATANWTAGTTPTTTTTPPTTTTTTEAPPTTTTTTSNTPAPQPKNEDLANTGASIFGPVMLGLVLVGAGLGAVLIVRRRKNA